MTEDDIYKSSTQYRIWSFAPEKLESLRAGTNELASARVKAAIDAKGSAATSEKRENGDATGEGRTEATNGIASSARVEVDTLTVGEERILVEYYASQAKSIGETKDFSLPIHVIATAVQFMKRFYLSNSPMTYHPRDLMITCLYFATKTEPFHFGLDKYVRCLQAGMKKSKKLPTAEDVLAPEFILTQGLRFTFDVKHPYRALRGAYMELNAMAEGAAALLRGGKRSKKEIQMELERLPDKNGATIDIHKRLDEAYGRAKETLGTSALFTDAYFLYTPSQIMFASLLLADEPLTMFYLDSKFPSSSPSDMKIKILATVRQCALLLKAGPSFQAVSHEELVRIDKKLFECRNPEKLDLVGLNKAQKRDEAVDGKLDESVAKRRKLEREMSAKDGDDLFGPAMGPSNGDVG